MSANENKEIQVVENNYINMKRMKTVSKEWIYTIKHGILTIQINEEKAEFICRMLADWLGFELVKKEVVRAMKEKSNLKSTKEYPLGKEHL